MSDPASSGPLSIALPGGGALLAAAWAITVLLLASLAVWLEWRYEPPAVAAPPVAALPVAEPPAAVAKAPAEATSGVETEAERAPPPPARPEVAARVGGGLVPAPDPDLVDSGPHGLLPVVAADGRRALGVYARPFDTGSTRPRIAIVIQEIGLSRATDEAVLDSLPPEITLALSPYGAAPQDTARRVREAGHEVLLMVPMEPLDWPANDPGPHSLLVDRPAAENLDRLHFVMSRFQGYVGLVNHMGSRFSASADALAPMMRDLAGRGVMVLDARATARSVIPQAAATAGVPVAVNNRYIDNSAAPEDIDRMLAELVAIAQAGGHAVGMARPYPVTLARIARWVDGLAARGIELAPVSALAGVPR